MNGRPVGPGRECEPARGPGRLLLRTISPEEIALNRALDQARARIAARAKAKAARAMRERPENVLGRSFREGRRR